MMNITVLLVVQAAYIYVAIRGLCLISNSSLFILLSKLIAHTGYCVQLLWPFEKILVMGRWDIFEYHCKTMAY